MAKRPKMSKTVHKRKRTTLVPRIPQSLRGLVRTTSTYARSRATSMGIPEKKYITYPFALGGVSTASTTGQNILCDNVSSTSIAQGTSENDRIGNKITVKNINLRFTLKLDPYSSVTYNNYYAGRFRVILLRDKQTNGTQCQLSDVFDGVTSYGNQFLHAFRNMDTIDRFDILYDKMHEMPNQSGYVVVSGTTATYVDDNVSKFVKISKKLSDRIDYAGTTGVISEMKSCSYTMFICPEPGSAPHTFSVDGTCRVKYFDS